MESSDAPASVAAHSKDVYETWHEQHEVDATADSPWHRLVQQYLNMPRDVTGKRVLEIACGRGGFTCWLARQPHPPSGIVASDFAYAAVKRGQAYAREHKLDDISWEVGDIQALAHPDASFDTVISCETVEHVPDSRRAINELARVLKPGGRLFLTAPNYMGMLGLYRFYLRLRGRVFTEVGQPINHFLLLPRTRSWISRAGLRVEKVDAVGHYLPFPGRPPIELSFLNNPRVLMRWFALHALIVAQKL
ncbi:MAG: methyltransferase domain-containing protein [Acidobacteria bacterium]|nr:methyltransferase domain-containing protein [Acidobacteriota bacterium]